MLIRVKLITLIITTLITSSQMNAKEPEVNYCVYANEVTSLFLNQVHKEYGFICTGSGGSMPYDIEKITVYLTAYRRATIDEARELQVILTENFAQIINSHEKIRPFLREYPFPPTRVDISISFENPKRKKRTPLANNEVTFVFQARNRIFYQADNPKSRYLYDDLKDEPYEEARAIVYKNDSKSKETFLPTNGNSN